MNGNARKAHWLSVVIVTAVICGLSSNSSQAAYTSVSSRSTLAGTDFIDWSAAGVDGASLSNPFTVNSNGGKSATVSQASSQAGRLTQGLTWFGNFATNDALLTTNGIVENGPIKIMFANAVTAAGTQIQTASLGTFAGKIDALAADGTTVLASFVYSGNSTMAGDNTAVFAGISASGSDQFFGIRLTGTALTGSGVALQPNNFTINRVSFTPTSSAPPPPSAVPVPAGMVLMLTGFPVLGFAGWTRRRATKA